MPLRDRELGMAFVAVVAAVGALSCAAMAEPAKPLTPDSAVADYCAAWNAPDRETRDRLLARVWAADGIYSDPEPTLAAGRAALSDAIADFHRHYPGARFRCSAPQAHHNVMRVTWSLRR
ncbi:nuclear transport factor 2 family protein, partial [Phenylobacterium sp.]|uniref:nuclear transport factor 2 family protein n=1 Tax=Phenylobacterium sp. TaxID=1871053 RepID=UPI002E300B55